MLRIHEKDENGVAFAHEHELEKSVGKNVIGWFALRHRKEKWWAGDEEGVNCYETRELAMIALTIVWRMDGGEEINFEIAEFTGANQRMDGDYEVEHDGETALRLYEESAQ